ELGADARKRLHQRMSKVIEDGYSAVNTPVLTPESISVLGACIDFLKDRDPAMGLAASEGFSKRVAQSQTVLHVEAGVEPPNADFPGIQVVGAELQRQVAPDESVEPLYLSRVTCRGDVRLVAEFDVSWQKAEQIGLLLYAGERRGYEF